MTINDKICDILYRVSHRKLVEIKTSNLVSADKKLLHRKICVDQHIPYRRELTCTFFQPLLNRLQCFTELRKTVDEFSDLIVYL